MNKEQWVFTAFDTLFFKESRPIESIGGSQLNSLFPPPAKTLIGATRTAIGNASGVNWQKYNSDENHYLREVMGDANNLGPLEFCGPYLVHNKERLFPVPLAYLAAQNPASGTQQTRLVPSEHWVECDLGKVKFPVKKDNNLEGAKPFSESFISAKGLLEFLSGHAITESLQHQDELYLCEPRLGIARDSNTRTASDGMLYQTNHIRPFKNVQIGISCQGLTDEIKRPSQDSVKLPSQGIIKLGAEGRIASWERTSASELPAINKPQNAKGLLLVLLTPALFSEGWLPEAFSPVTRIDGQQVWMGSINNIELCIECSVIGKPVREGGWNMAAKAPRTLSSLVPAGSCYFCTISEEENLETAQKSLHGIQIGNEHEYGRGQLAVGYW